MEGARGVRFFEAVLPIAAQQKPILEIARLQARGTLITLAGLQAGIMSGERVSNAEVRKEQEANKSKRERDGAMFRIKGTVTHPTVLCLDHEAVARKIR